VIILDDKEILDNVLELAKVYAMPGMPGAHRFTQVCEFIVGSRAENIPKIDKRLTALEAEIGALRCLIAKKE
jgi:hypothetical protein